MYADDTTLYFNLEDFNSVTMNNDINSCLDKINVWLNPGMPYGTYMSHVFFLHLLH